MSDESAAAARELERERAHVLRRSPLVVAHASELARPGDFVTHDASGVPLLLTRSEDGLRGFVNVCRHRATRVEQAASGSGKRCFVCPLHGWSYDLEGDLADLPEDQGFSFVDKTKMSLTRVPIAEAFGLIWVVLRPLAKASGDATTASIDPRAFAVEISTELDRLELGNLRVQKRSALAQPLDWKLAVEAFLSCHEAAKLDARGRHLHIEAFEGDPAATLIFPNTVILAGDAEVSLFHVFPIQPGSARIVGVRLARDGAGSDLLEPPPFRRDERAGALFGRALSLAIEEGGSSR